MAWARLDDQFWSNPKVVAAENDAAGVFARALCYASAHNTDGFVPDAIAALITDPGAGATRTKRERDANKVRAELAANLRKRVTNANLWVPCEPGDVFQIRGRKDTGRRPLPDVDVTIKAHGYYIRDFLHYNRASTDARAGESTDARATVQRVRADAQSSESTLARAARPVPSPTNKEPSLPSNGSREGLEGLKIGEVLKAVTP